MDDDDAFPVSVCQHKTTSMTSCSLQTFPWTLVQTVQRHAQLVFMCSMTHDGSVSVHLLSRYTDEKARRDWSTWQVRAGASTNQRSSRQRPRQIDAQLTATHSCNSQPRSILFYPFKSIVYAHLNLHFYYINTVVKGVIIVNRY